MMLAYDDKVVDVQVLKETESCFEVIIKDRHYSLRRPQIGNILAF